MTRRELRENIFKIIFRTEFHDREEMPEQEKEYDIEFAKVLSESEEEDEKLKKDEEYIRAKAKAITDHLDEIDKMLEEAAEGWTLKRIGKAEIAILRVALYEIKYDDDIPFKVAVNEAVELSKKYCEPEAASFINGILAKFA
ncbi:MAG: transcription antitermination factor NusB [Eubacterium sp.]|nr:transcription antitermination factor NusB [Eubacterium sp.]SEF52340.1 NusB antitermination factor [Eubacterium ruminantium]